MGGDGKRRRFQISRTTFSNIVALYSKASRFISLQGLKSGIWGQIAIGNFMTNLL